MNWSLWLVQASLLPPVKDLLQEFDGLIGRFEVQFKSFERKRYLNLSHEPNKAMNVNGYLGLMGRRLSERITAKGTLLVDAKGEHRFAFQSPRRNMFLLFSSHADSLLKESYARVLVGYMGQPWQRTHRRCPDTVFGRPGQPHRA